MDSDMSLVGRNNCDKIVFPIVYPAVAERTTDPTQAINRVPGVDTFMTEPGNADVSTANVQQSDLHQTLGDREVPSDMGSGTRTDMIFAKEQQPILRDNSPPLGILFQPETNRASGTDERRSRQHLSPLNQSISYEETHSEPVTAPTSVTHTRKEWERLVCRGCLNADHPEKHRELSGYKFSGKTGALGCGHRKCRRWISSLHTAKFVSKPDCNHNRSRVNSIDITSRLEAPNSEPIEQFLDRKGHNEQVGADLQHSHQMVSRSATKHLSPPRSGIEKPVKRSKPKTNTEITRNATSFIEYALTQREELVLERAYTASPHRQPRVPSGVVLTSGSVRHGTESFNLDILDTYQGKCIEENKVEESWLRIATKISEFDRFVRDVASSKDVRGKLSLLDNITPFSALREIAEEIKILDNVENKSALLWLFKSMLNVSIYVSLDGVISDQILQLKFPFVLQATLAYLLHLRIFIVSEMKSEWREREKCVVAVLGKQRGAELLQFMHLEELKSDHFKRQLRIRASELAHSIYTTLLPLYRLVEGAITGHNQDRQLEILTRLTYDCLTLAAELRAREGTFHFIWPAYESHFDPEIHSVHASQSEAISGIPEEIVNRQVIAFAFMPVVLRMLPNDKKVYTYAQGVVLLREPYAE